MHGSPYWRILHVTIDVLIGDRLYGHVNTFVDLISKCLLIYMILDVSEFLYQLRQLTGEKVDAKASDPTEVKLNFFGTK